MPVVREQDLDEVLVWVRYGGFPGEATDDDVIAARALLEVNPQARAVLLALGGGTFLWVDASVHEPAKLIPDTPRDGEEGEQDGGPGGFALGVGDGATLPGLPLSWRLLRFVCPRGDTVVLLPRYLDPPPTCPLHRIALEYQRDMS